MHIVETALARQLSDTVGPEHLLDDPRACAAYAIHGRLPGLVVAPASVEELSGVMAAAHAAEAAVAIWGGGTRQLQGHRPARLDLVVRTERLSRVLEHEPADLTISVEAGLPMARLHTLLASHGQMLPVDVPLPARATVGGVLATAADGPRRLGYGTLRDLLIGIGVVEATGRRSKAGGMVVKNVSGFDMMKLYLGSFGSLAMIASANFKLLPRPRAAATVLCGFASRTGCFRLADALHTSQLSPAAAEYLGGYRPRLAPESWQIRSDEPEAPAMHYLAVWVEGLPAAVTRQQRDVAALARESGADDVEPVQGNEHRLLWQAIADLPQAASVLPGELLLRLSCLPSELVRAIDDGSAQADRLGLRLAICARALSGLAYLRLRGADDALAQAHAALLRAWPSLNVLAAAPDLAARLDLWGHAGEGTTLMRRIKHEFDPLSMLNPGRFVV
jgi:glycolate oxidase FAD binding subunit